MINITLTGADERTPISELVKLADMGAEIGLLYTHSPDGRNRYPSREYINKACWLWEDCAIHICGQRAKKEFMYDFPFTSARRFQLNGKWSSEDVQFLCDRYQDKKFITQYPLGEDNIIGVNSYANHEILVDSSGGRGVKPRMWQRPDTVRRVGFAGGLNASNLLAELPKIAAVGGDDWWIDLESGLRDADDWFSVELANEVMERFLEWKVTSNL